MFASAWLMGGFGWGSWAGLLFLGLAFGVHVLAVADVMSQRAFPALAGGAPTFSTSAVIGVGIYGPVLLLANHFAWPGERHGASGEQYLVDRGSYATRPPSPGEWVFFRVREGQGFDLGRVLAGPGDELEWVEGAARINGRVSESGEGLLRPEVRALRMTVPEGQWLIAAAGEVNVGGDRLADRGELMLVARDDLIGRPWAQSLPLRSRRLLL
jgi:hypothetical protein